MRIFWTGLIALSLDVLTGAGEAITQEVYVWQRQFTPDVYESVNAAHEKVAAFAVLAAEIGWSGKQPTLFRSPVSYTRLAAARRPIAVVLRIGPYSGTFAQGDRVGTYLAETAAAILQVAKTEGVNPVELQVDFDCASSKLAGYREWLKALRIAVAPAKLVFTALPDWLMRRDFSALAQAADGYVLQVHSLEKPDGIETHFQLCDPERSWAWIEKAAEVGVPFRVALPTYGYRLAFDPSGKFIALGAEGIAPPWPAGTQVRFVHANADDMARLAVKIAREKPANCRGIIWFRLPVSGDELNWDLITFNALLEGRTPISRLVVETRWTAPGLAEISLVNAGERDEALPDKILARWADGEPPQTMDGLGGYSTAFDSFHGETMTLTPRSSLAGKVIAPGRVRKIGWLHFNHETTLFSEIVVSP